MTDYTGKDINGEHGMAKAMATDERRQLLIEEVD